jgi:hypothetical protein
MDDFRARVLENPSHDIDGRVMAVKQRCGGNDLDGVFRGIRLRFLSHDGSF